MVKGGFNLRNYAFVFFAVGLLAILLATSATNPSQIALPNCPDKCGNITVPYPFGIGDNCHYYNDPSGGYHFFNLTCNSSNVPPTLTYGKDLSVASITLNGEFRINREVAYLCYDELGSWIEFTRPQVDMEKFTISTTENLFVSIGCDTYSWFEGLRRDTMSDMTTTTKDFHSGCMSWCTGLDDVKVKKCSDGIGCCQVNIPSGLSEINVTAKSFYNHTEVYDFNPCSVAFMVANDSMPTFQDLLSKDVTYFRNLRYPVVFDWSIGTENCLTAVANKTSYTCKGNSSCYDWPDKQGYRCKCNEGYEGNPYLHGCQDIDECSSPARNKCVAPGICANTPGDYTCNCPKGYSGNGTINDLCVRKSFTNNKVLLAITIIAGVGGGIIVAILLAHCMYWQHGKRRLMKLRENFFRQNGGNILQQKLNNRNESVGMVRIFTEEELKKAKNNYSESSIVGRGGFGVVYKGTLPPPNSQVQVVAIKRSLKVDSSQIEQFINEVLVVSQINNRNVVKLLGCCLETEVPLLVYEFIRNGTLHDHLHDETKACSLTWSVRLRIACEVAEVLAYLHTTISIPIIHRDIKSVNILLDEIYTAKVSDFGASKLVPADKEQLATIVQGTCGYLDPEYMQTGELTEKSDVYSYGVVLVELLTREKAISYAKPETERSLAIYFLRKLKEDRLYEILDDKIMTDEAVEQLKEVANLARRCLELKGKDRPTMKEISRELDAIKGRASHPWYSDNVGDARQEECEYLLGETQMVKTDFGGKDGIDPLSNQSNILELVPQGDGR